MKFLKICFSLFLIVSFQAFSAQNNEDKFEVILELEHLPVLDQGSTGTCWSFATTSFLESEILRKGYPKTDLSEIYFVYYAFLNKADNYLKADGQASFSQGGQAHDVIDVLKEHGMVTYDAFEGKKVNGSYLHRPLSGKLKKELDKLIKIEDEIDIEKNRSFNGILKKHLGKVPRRFKSTNSSYKPNKFPEKFEIHPDNYIELTSYNHHPFYKPYVLDVRDNWSKSNYYNIPVDELMEVILHSLKNGYTVCWDGDTSEKTFQHKQGLADLPKKLKGKVDQQLRQKTFENGETTDDHLMHIVGLSKNNSGENCFYTKNSWGVNSNDFGGYLHMTEDYVRLKTIAILVHKNAIPDNIRKKLHL
jgi:bleomycin hydrolase